MRLNKYLALATGCSRRAADELIAADRVRINGSTPTTGAPVQPGDAVTLDGQPLAPPAQLQTIMLHKPTGYVCSRRGQGSQTIYALLPTELHHLKPIGRLDKDSSGLLLLTNDGTLANQLTHPRYTKQKLYQVQLDKPLSRPHMHQINHGIRLPDGLSRLAVTPATNGYRVVMAEGRNRQIRRTFAALGYSVTSLHRTQFGPYRLGKLAAGRYAQLD